MEFRYQKVHDKGRPVHEADDGFELRHPVMDLVRRAKLFQPFDALQGFVERIRDSEVRYAYKGQQDEERDRSI